MPTSLVRTCHRRFHPAPLRTDAGRRRVGNSSLVQRQRSLLDRSADTARLDDRLRKRRERDALSILDRAGLRIRQTFRQRDVPFEIKNPGSHTEVLALQCPRRDKQRAALDTSTSVEG